jgi:hypothetical protein
MGRTGLADAFTIGKGFLGAMVDTRIFMKDKAFFAPQAGFFIGTMGALLVFTRFAAAFFFEKSARAIFMATAIV